jgi:preflagellin peptidase FlaK
LLYASYTDVKTRRAANILWIITGGVGFILLLVQYMIKPIDMVYLIVIPVALLFFYMCFQLGLFGGADAKGLMSLSLLGPWMVFDVFFIACMFSMFTIPFIYFYYRRDISFDMILSGVYPFPFMVSILFGFVFTFIFGGLINNMIENLL